MADQRKATLCALTAVLIWSTMASAFKLSLRYLDPIQLLFYASLFAILTLGTVLGMQGKLGQAFRCRADQYRRSLLFGLLNPFLYYLVLFKAYDLLPAQQAQPLNYTWSITLALLSVPLLGHRIRRLEFLALFISYAGVVVIATEGRLLQFDVTSPLGVVLALGSTLAWALYWIYNTRDQRDPVVALFVNFLCAFPVLLGCVLLFSSLSPPPLEGLLGATYIGLMEMGASFVFWLLALKHTENAARIGNLVFLSPFLSLGLIHILVGEAILPSTLFGLLLIVAGLLMQRRAVR